MAGAKMMKIAYVTRNNAKNNREHSIVQVSQFKPKDFALQMQLMLENSWAVLRCLIDECMRLPSGKYLLLKVITRLPLRVVRVVSSPQKFHKTIIVYRTSNLDIITI